MDGEVTNLLGSSTEYVERLRDLMAGTRLEVAYRQFIEANQLCEAAKQRLATARKELAREMRR
jgi:exonuclease VII small subunit